MRSRHIQDILPLVEAPSRYLGSEINTIQKDLGAAKLKFALAFPDLYEIGTSHFGLQILYHILNQNEDIAAERVFAPAPDMQDYLREMDIPLQSLESRVPIADFDIVGFSLLYELNYTNVLGMLDLAGIPFKSQDRDHTHPMIIAGGPCTCNPEPVAAFFDAIVIGDGEEVVLQMAQAWMDWKEQDGRSRPGLLKAWSRLKGVYIPAFYDLVVDGGVQAVVERAVLADLDGASFPSAPIVPYGRPVHDRLRLELARGCTRGCRFCQAGMIYRPVRERNPKTVLQQCDQALKTTGYDDISLLSLSTGDYRCIGPLMEQLIQRYACDHVAISLPSLRAGTLTPELMQHIKSVRKTGFTIAPEAGSQRLRDLINKNITARDIIQTVEDAFALGWKVIKLYFMVGLPTETRDDLEALVELVKELARIKGPGGKRSQINVSVATMIPKPHTPFQWAPQISIEKGWENINWLKRQLRSPRIRLKWQNPEVSYIEGLMARGDRQLSDLIIAAYRRGCRLDGWSDHFRFDLWEDCIRDTGLDADAIVNRGREADEIFPWEHIDLKVKRSFLWDEWQKALKGDITDDCRDGACQDCGVCNFTTVQPRVFPNESDMVPPATPSSTALNDFQHYWVSFAKTGPGRYWGHLEMVNIFVRALRRAGIPLKFSEGFHPKPKMAFDDALPIGLESLCETMRVTVGDRLSAEAMVARINRELPDGLHVTDCKRRCPSDGGTDQVVAYRITLNEGQFDTAALKEFQEAAHFIFERTNRKGKLKKIDLKDMIRHIRTVKPDTLEMAILHRPEALIRPDVVLRNVFKMTNEAIRRARMIKIGYQRYDAKVLSLNN